MHMPREDPLNDETFEKAHRKAERHEKQIKNGEKEKAQHEKVQLDRLLEELRGPDWLRVMGVSGVTDGEKKKYEPKRALFIKEIKAMIEKFKHWKEEEKRRKLEREQAWQTEEEPEADEEEEDDEDDEEVADDSERDGDGDAEDADDGAAKQEEVESQGGSESETAAETDDSGSEEADEGEAEGGIKAERQEPTRPPSRGRLGRRTGPTAKTGKRKNRVSDSNDLDALAARQLLQEAKIAQKRPRKTAAAAPRPGPLRTRPQKQARKAGPPAAPSASSDSDEGEEGGGTEVAGAKEGRHRSSASSTTASTSSTNSRSSSAVAGSASASPSTSIRVRSQRQPRHQKQPPRRRTANADKLRPGSDPDREREREREREPPFTSFYAKRHLREAAIGRRQRGRAVSAFGQPLPEMVDDSGVGGGDGDEETRDFELPAHILTDDAIRARQRNRRRVRRGSAEE